MNKIYYDTKSNQYVELIDLNDNKRFMIVKPIGGENSLMLEFQKGFLPSVYLEKYFIEKQEIFKDAK